MKERTLSEISSSDEGKEGERERMKGGKKEEWLRDIKFVVGKRGRETVVERFT